MVRNLDLDWYLGEECLQSSKEFYITNPQVNLLTTCSYDLRIVGITPHSACGSITMQDASIQEKPKLQE